MNTNDKKRANYQKIIKDTGEIIEMIGTYNEPQDRIVNPPEMLSEDEQKVIIELMQKNGIKKLDVIL